mmetsp:Transcript_46485/g.108302  ORF Transcript_46485/g.108302 Transcript_46485/m.108302 type:complete len:253 (-) Transcript_46485:1359-2117(-)
MAVSKHSSASLTTFASALTHSLATTRRKLPAVPMESLNPKQKTCRLVCSSVATMPHWHASVHIACRNRLAVHNHAAVSSPARSPAVAHTPAAGHSPAAAHSLAAGHSIAAGHNPAAVHSLAGGHSPAVVHNPAAGHSPAAEHSPVAAGACSLDAGHRPPVVHSLAAGRGLVGHQRAARSHAAAHSRAHNPVVRIRVVAHSSLGHNPAECNHVRCSLTTDRSSPRTWKLDAAAAALDRRAHTSPHQGTATVAA